MKRSNKLDLTGQKFGMLTVIAHAGKSSRGEIFWLCSCACGGEKRVRASHLRSGNSTSCGCGRVAAITSHGMTKTPTFKSWDSMKQRCLNPNAPDYDRYGGRGIGICAEWINSFETFLADMGLRPDGTTLDRIDNSAGYSPKNCRWSTSKVQSLNKRSNLFVNWQNQTWRTFELAKAHSLKPAVLANRLRSGWEIGRALSEPSRKGRRRKASTKGLN